MTLRGCEFHKNHFKKNITKALLNEKRQTSEYLFGIEEREGLPTENVSASWNFSKVDVLLIQTGFINLWDKTKGGKKD